LLREADQISLCVHLLGEGARGVKIGKNDIAAKCVKCL